MKRLQLPPEFIYHRPHLAFNNYIFISDVGNSESAYREANRKRTQIYIDIMKNWEFFCLLQLFVNLGAKRFAQIAGEIVTVKPDGEVVIEG